MPKHQRSETEAILDEECAGILDLGERFLSSLYRFIGSTVLSGNENWQSGILLQAFYQLEVIVEKLKVPSPMTIEEKAELAGGLFDILNMTASASQEVPKIVEWLDVQKPKEMKGANARQGKTKNAKALDEAIIAVLTERGLSPKDSSKMAKIIRPDVLKKMSLNVADDEWPTNRTIKDHMARIKKNSQL